MKQIKILSVLALTLTLGLTACNGGGKTSSKHKHEWGEWVETKAATCKEEGSKEHTCKTCGEKATQKIDKLDHTWGEWATVTEAKCEEAGSRKRVCTVCQEEETEEVAAKGHTFEKDEAGEEIVTWVKQATCEEAGNGTKHCTVCQKDVPFEQEALGHEWTTEGGTASEAEAGFATFYEFPCKNGCGKTSLGFKANEPTDESKSHLVFSDPNEKGEVGARFWGRPIGNAMELGDDGSASGADAEKIFDETVTGDFFEYKFKLSKEQAETLSTCYCYCDAKPASYLGGQDFWACDPSAEEWTPGYYIEGEKKGEPIADYRYILYVDGQPQSFDSEIKAPVSGRGGSEPRAEYIMPFTFHLKEGTNTIRLVMAGGYRSVFYNFYFRAPEATPAVNPGE